LLVGGILGGVASFLIYTNVAALVGRWDIFNVTSRIDCICLACFPSWKESKVGICDDCLLSVAVYCSFKLLGQLMYCHETLIWTLCHWRIQQCYAF
jgi:hypothetical protein